MIYGLIIVHYNVQNVFYPYCPVQWLLATWAIGHFKCEELNLEFYFILINFTLAHFQTAQGVPPQVMGSRLLWKPDLGTSPMPTEQP